MLVRITAAAALLAASFATAADAQELVPGEGIYGVAPAPDTAEPRDKFWFDNGFAQLHEQIGSIMGTAVGPERAGDDDDVVQRTSTGLAVWKPGKEPSFTDGWRTWAVEPPAEQRTASVTPSVAYGMWDRLAMCEASGNWANSRNPKYKGGLQMDSTFWARYGGLAFASAPHLASREQQIIVAERGLAVQGPGAWPVCSRVVGMRR